MEHPSSNIASKAVNTESWTRLSSSSPSSEQDSSINKTVQNENTADKGGRRHSSSFSTIVGSIGSRLKRSSSSVTSPSSGKTSTSSVTSGNLSTPTNRKFSAAAKIPSETVTGKQPPQSPSRRSSTPVDQRIDTSTSSSSKAKKSSLRGIFSSTRKHSLQQQPNSNGSDQLPPRPPSSVRGGLPQDTHTKTDSFDLSNNISNQLVFREDIDNRIRNGTNSSMPKTTQAAPQNNAFGDRRQRIHKHSLQQGNKWKLLQQKVLGNVDEENDDEHDLLKDGKFFNHGVVIQDKDKLYVSFTRN